MGNLKFNQRCLLDLFFPKICVHCFHRSDAIFCSGCSPYFELIDPSTRCLLCFEENFGSKVCASCNKTTNWHIRKAAALENVGPVTTFLKRLRSENNHYLAKSAAAFMLIQLERIRWADIDFVVPVPHKPWIWQSRDHVFCMAKFLSNYLKIPINCCLKMGIFDFYIGRSFTKMLKIDKKKSRDRNALHGKNVLLVDDLLGEMSALHSLIEELRECCPSNIYVLTLAQNVFRSCYS